MRFVSANFQKALDKCLKVCYTLVTIKKTPKERLSSALYEPID